ncbi:MAG: glycosyl hydrolase, partial [Candidatus Marinimicrobia bacterium]|nr:glycosyl hydrolase [Candidatus Neomarinimicrobiota bacterium]
LRTWDLDVNGGKLGPKVIPGKYIAVLQIDDNIIKQTFNVLKDPNTTGTIRDIKAQFNFLLNLRETINENVTLINKIEELRYSLQNNFSSKKEEKAARDMDMRLYEIESHLFDVKLTGAREDAFRNPNKIYGRLAALGSDLTRFGADFKPTNQQIEVFKVLSDRLEKQQKDFNILMKDDYWDSEKNKN